MRISDWSSDVCSSDLLIADGLEAVDAIFQRRVVQIGNARFDGVIEAFEAQFRFGGALVEFGDMRAAAISVFFPAVQSGGKDGFQPLGLRAEERRGGKECVRPSRHRWLRNL